MNTLRPLTCIVFTLTCFTGLLHTQDDDLARLFSDRNLTGTLIIESLDGKTLYRHNPERSEERFIPASTFKIPNTLIALDAGALKDENEVIKWDGQKRFLPDWNRDQALPSAFRYSCVWFYQELARRVGDEAYRKYLGKLEYGNRLTGPKVDTFWLDGEIRISAREQVNFLRRLVNNDLPFKPNHIDLLKKIMINEERPEHVLRAKTGWAVRTGTQIGWFVGWLERKNGEVWLFALNFDSEYDKDKDARKQITLDALKLKGLLER